MSTKNKLELNWSTENQKEFFPAKKTISKVPKGYYQIKYNDFGYFLSKKEIEDEEYEINSIQTKLESLLSEIDTFWSLEDKFKKIKLPFNKTIALLGEPGNGKGFVLNKIFNQNIKKGCIVIEIEEPEDYITFASTIKDIENGTKIIYFVKGIDYMMEKFGFLPVVDLIEKINVSNNALCLITSDSIERLAPLMQNSSKCFDTQIDFNNPSEEERLVFVEEKLKQLSKRNNKKEVQKIVEDTNGLSFEEIKKLIVLSYVFNEEYEDKLGEIKTIRHKYIDQDENGVLGFKM